MTTRTKHYYKDGFTLDGCVNANGLIYMGVATVEILKGQALHDNGSGLATNATTALANTFLGIAAHDLDNNPAVTGVKIAIIRPMQDHRFWVKVEADALVATDNVGETCDLEANDSIDVSDETLVAWGFKILEIDVSTGAVAANTYGYAKGVFEKQPQ